MLLANPTPTNTTLDSIKMWLMNKGASTLDFIIKLIIAFIIFYLVRKLLNKLIKSLQKRMDTKEIDHTASHFILNLVKYAILVLVFVSIITSLNIVKEASIAALVASAGVGISLAMQGALSNFAGGILLLMIRPFEKGDYIIVPNASVEGTVEEIALYYTTIRTITNDLVHIPNSSLTNNSVVNKTGDENRFLMITVNVAYDTDIVKAKELLRNILDNESRILPDVKNSFVEELGESSVKLGMVCKVKVLEYNDVRHDINELILKRFKDESIKIPYNQLDVHLVDNSI